MKAGRLVAALSACAGRPPPPSPETERPRMPLPRAPSWADQPDVMLALLWPSGRV